LVVGDLDHEICVYFKTECTAQPGIFGDRSDRGLKSRESLNGAG